MQSEQQFKAKHSEKEKKSQGQSTRGGTLERESVAREDTGTLLCIK